MRLNKEQGARFVAFVTKQVRRDLCLNKENVSTTAMNTVLWTAMNVCFTTGSLSRTFWICQRSIATRAHRSERWISEVMHRLQTAGYIHKITQKVYSPGVFGPNVFKLGKKLMALFFAFIKLSQQDYTLFVTRKRDAYLSRKQTSNLNLKKERDVVVFPSSSSAYSFIPDIRRFIKSMG